FRDLGHRSVTEEEWVGYINDVYAEVMAARPDWPFMEHVSASLTIVPPTNIVDLPTDAWKVTAVYNATDKYPMNQVDGRDAHLWLYPQPGDARGTPQNYRLHNRQ